LYVVVVLCRAAAILYFLSTFYVYDGINYMGNKDTKLLDSYSVIGGWMDGLRYLVIDRMDRGNVHSVDNLVGWIKVTGLKLGGY
jgi:hypothetical protein